MKPIPGFKNIHFVGIGGSGMSSLAEVLHQNGFEVSGSDIQESNTTLHLKSKGIEVNIGPGQKDSGVWDAVVYSSAVSQDNVSLVSAKSRGVAIIKRAQLLGEIMKKKYSLAVAGTHGKTTTTLMLASIMNGLDEKPTVIGGGVQQKSQSSAISGDSPYLIAEADEYDRSFLKMFPTVALVNNIDADHLECYDSYEHLENCFLDFIDSVPFYGFACVCGSDPGVQKILSRIQAPYVSYGMEKSLDCYAQNVVHGKEGSRFEIFYNGSKLGELNLQLSGNHNILNALGAASVALKLDIPFSNIKKGLESFNGAARRMEVVGEKNGIKIIDDYAHHPSEIKATLEALKNWNSGKLFAIFQPHLYSRTKRLYQDFAQSLALADKIAVLPIYAAREKNIDNVSSQLIVGELKNHFPEIELFEAEKEIVNQVFNLKPGDIIVTLGAGDVWKWGRKILEEVEHA